MTLVEPDLRRWAGAVMMQLRVFKQCWDAFEELDSCQEEMAGRLDADAIGESESMLYLDLFLARVLIASIGCDYLDSTLWDGSLGQIGGQVRGREKGSIEADLQSLRSRTLRESLTRGVEGALRSLELICLPTLSGPGAGGGRADGRMHEVSLNVSSYRFGSTGR